MNVTSRHSVRRADTEIPDPTSSPRRHISDVVLPAAAGKRRVAGDRGPMLTFEIVTPLDGAFDLALPGALDLEVVVPLRTERQIDDQRRAHLRVDRRPVVHFASVDAHRATVQFERCQQLVRVLGVVDVERDDITSTGDVRGAVGDFEIGHGEIMANRGDTTQPGAQAG